MTGNNRYRTFDPADVLAIWLGLYKGNALPSEAERDAARERLADYDPVDLLTIGKPDPRLVGEDGKPWHQTEGPYDRLNYADLENRVEVLTAKLNGYVNRMATEPPGNPKGRQRRGREWRKIRHRTPYQLNPDGTFRRVKGQWVRSDWVQKFPLKVCENCGSQFAAGRSDAKTCSNRCRQALKRQRKAGNSIGGAS